MATIREIAEEAGVSRMTVSNVINNVKGKVSPETEKRIREIMEKHHYVPSMAARSLISKSSHIIGILLPQWAGNPNSMLLTPYAAYVVAYFEELLRAKGYYVMLCSFAKAEDAVMIQRTWHTDGMIEMFPHDDPINHELVERSECPLVVMDRHFDDLQMLSVGIEDRKGGYLAARHLLEEGHRQIGIAASSIESSQLIRERYEGYAEALAEYGLEPRKEWIFDGTDRHAGGIRVAEQLLGMRERPTAMVCTEDLIACGIMKRYQERGLNVPQDISLVGFDNSEPSRVVTPMLTTVNQFIRKKAETAVEMMLRAITDPEYRNDRKTLDVDLVKRESVARLA
ncbi:MAG: LacI family DNA-binding transcriptional regulator [Clostridia bacterium]|nr:LacI family DNA-binding transcriptional regulator [Clostridia bacterium]